MCRKGRIPHPAEVTLAPPAPPASTTAPTDLDDDTLARRFAAADSTVLRAVYERYAAPMTSTALHLLGDRTLAEEAVHTAMLKAWRAAATFDPERALAPWLFAIVRRCAIDLLRRERRHRVDSLDAVGAEPSVPGGNELEVAWEAWTVRQALDMLPPEEHSVIQLAYYDRYSHSEIAKRLSIPVGTVKSRTARAHARLRVHLGALQLAS
jgi:RNA polymerase sigma-70 factor (ECF subfamily)